VTEWRIHSFVALQPIHTLHTLAYNMPIIHSKATTTSAVASILLAWLLLAALHVDLTSGLAAPSAKSSSSNTSRRRWIRDTFTGLASLVAVVGTTTTTTNDPHRDVAEAATTPPVPMTIVDVEGGSGGIGISAARAVNPFVRFDTVSMIPDEYFRAPHQSLYGFTERILDGDTIRIRHVPGYGINVFTAPEPLQQRGIADDTLIVRLYAVDCPETAKRKDQISQPFGDAAKLFTADLLFHKMVKITLLRRDQYGRAVAMVETVPAAGPATAARPNSINYGDGSILLVNAYDDTKNKGMDVSMELARRGLAELYTGGGAEYNVRIQFAAGCCC
jgi:endonuclease YncB( thermonuclease family)